MKPLAFSGVLLVNILLSLFVGYKLDAFLHTNPIFLILGLFYGVFGSIYILIHQAARHE